MGKLFPRFFSSSHESSTDAKKTKKSTRVDGQSFPFRSLSGSGTQTEGFEMSYGEAGERSGRGDRTSTVKTKSTRADLDNVSEGSEEWIIEPQEQPGRAKEPV